MNRRKATAGFRCRLGRNEVGFNQMRLVEGGSGGKKVNEGCGKMG